MIGFQYQRPGDLSGALNLGAAVSSKFIGGGTNLLDLMKEGIERPEHVVDINGLDLKKIGSSSKGGLEIGALVSNSAVASHSEVLARYPLLAKAILAGASPQLRNMATTGGNLLQRTRCYYFYDAASSCNKRNPGSGCDAKQGHNRIHAVLGASEACVAVHPSDFCVGLAALEATVNVRGEQGAREIAFADFHRLPGDSPQFETNLKQGELILSVSLPAKTFAHSAYVKVRDRWSYAFALVSAAAAMNIKAGKIEEARFALGGVAAKPWRVPEAEAYLAGKAPEEAVFREAAEIALKGAQALEHNGFKIELAKRAVVRAFTESLVQEGNSNA
jgi:xanthine dehydrogenase YagS FAD-binding subunit